MVAIPGSFFIYKPAIDSMYQHTDNLPGAYISTLSHQNLHNHIGTIHSQKNFQETLSLTRSEERRVGKEC